MTLASTAAYFLDKIDTGTWIEITGINLGIVGARRVIAKVTGK